AGSAAASAPAALLAQAVLRHMAVRKFVLALGGLLAITALGLGICQGARFAVPAENRAEAGEAPPLVAPAPRERRTGGPDVQQHRDQGPLGAAPARKAAVLVSASNFWDEHTPDKAFDGGRHTLWNSSSYAPQWLEADLGAPTRLSSILLVASQLPAGQTTHEIWVSDEPIADNPGKAKRAHTFRGFTKDGQQLRVDFPRDLVARHV